MKHLPIPIASIFTTIVACSLALAASPNMGSVASAAEEVARSSPDTVIACKACKRSFDKDNHNGYCPFCGEDNNKSSEIESTTNQKVVGTDLDLAPVSRLATGVDTFYIGNGQYNRTAYVTNNGTKTVVATLRVSVTEPGFAPTEYTCTRTLTPGNRSVIGTYSGSGNGAVSVRIVSESEVD